jgi:NAD(P)-dependent dehydrogenase (short-subunit alcohol dehydrogenase family)
MRELRDKVAVITGAGSGIGRAVALELAGAGMHVVVADLDPGAAQLVADEVAALGVRGLPVATDVGDRASVEALAVAAYNEFGEVHVLHNNAGLALLLLLENTTDADWDLIMRVNLLGVVNGIQAFLPRMRAQDGEKHIVCTASMSGIVAFPTLGAYTATKYAVVGICETLRQEAAKDNIGVSVLCPGPVQTNILINSDKQRPDAFADAMLVTGDRDPEEAASSMRYLEAADVGRLVRIGIEENELYIFTHTELEAPARMRFEDIARGYERLAQRLP